MKRRPSPAKFYRQPKGSRCTCSVYANAPSLKCPRHGVLRYHGVPIQWDRIVRTVQRVFLPTLRRDMGRRSQFARKILRSTP